MASTYLELCNRVLRRLNETLLDESTFENTRGIHATVKDAVVDSINFIQTIKSPWKFNACKKQLVLTEGRSEYPFPSDFLSADWNSFRIKPDSMTSPKALRKISRDEWLQSYRNNSFSDGMPFFVFDSHSNQFGIYPAPDKEYEIEYWYFSIPKALELHSDQTTIPSRYNFVIVTGAMYFMNMFKGDNESAAMVENKFRQQIRDMWLQVGPVNTHAFDTRIPQKGY